MCVCVCACVNLSEIVRHTFRVKGTLSNGKYKENCINATFYILVFYSIEFLSSICVAAMIEKNIGRYSREKLSLLKNSLRKYTRKWNSKRKMFRCMLGLMRYYVVNEPLVIYGLNLSKCADFITTLFASCFLFIQKNIIVGSKAKTPTCSSGFSTIFPKDLENFSRLYNVSRDSRFSLKTLHLFSNRLQTFRKLEDFVSKALQ